MRKTKAAIASAVLLAALSSCSTGGGSVDSGDGITLRFANWQWQEPGRGEAIYAAVEAYNQENPDVQIEKVEITRADYEKTISTQIGSGEGPDLLISPLPFFYTMADSEVLVPLDDVLTPEQESSLRANNEELVIEGDQLAFVWGVAPYALFWNQQLLDEAGVEAPETPEELVDAVVEVHEKTGKIGFATRHQLNEEAAWWDDFASWTYGFGEGWTSDGELAIDSEENIAALETFEELYRSGAFAVGDNASTFRSKFAAGDVAFILDNATVVSTSIEDSTVVSSSDVGAAPLPFPTGSSGAQINAIGINANSEHQEEAKDFLQWLFEPENQEHLAEAQFPAAPGTEIDAPRHLMEENPWVNAFYTQLEDSNGTVIPGYEIQTPQIRNVILTRIQEVLSAGTDPREALESAQEDAERIQ